MKVGTVIQLKPAIPADERHILRPFDKRECLSLKQAAGIAGKSESTLRGWCDQHGLGRHVGGKFGSSAKSLWRCSWTGTIRPYGLITQEIGPSPRPSTISSVPVSNFLSPTPSVTIRRHGGAAFRDETISPPATPS